jgi:integrase
MRGSVFKDDSGRWAFVIDLPPREGKRRQARRRGYATRRDAQTALQKLVGEIATGVFVEPSKVTIKDSLELQWLPSLPALVRPTTADTYERLVKRHVLPALGPTKLQQLDRAAVASWLVGLTTAGLSPKSVRNIHGVLAKALADALELELVSRNVAAHPRALPPAKRPEPRVWSSDQLRVFLGSTAEDRLGTLWRFIAATGCRRGEALGLRWVDVDLEAGTACITRQRTIAGGSIVEGEPKTPSGARTVALDAGTVRALRAWRKSQTEDRLAAGAGWIDSGLVFTHPHGAGLWPQMVTASFREAARLAGLPHLGVHGLRHSAATFMIASGVNPKVVQQRLGHANVSVTLGLYTHVLPAHDREAAALLGKALGEIP